jgi:hypothetical protein
MVVPAYLTDPEVVSKTLRLLGFPMIARALAPAGSSVGAVGFEPADDPPRGGGESEDRDEIADGPGRAPPIHPPP